MQEPPGWHSRGYLPHYDNGQVLQSVTFRLADSLPATAIARLGEQTLDDNARRVAIEAYIDAGHGKCLLREPENAELVIETLFHDEGKRCHFHAWVIMPNHLHLLIEPLAHTPVSELVGSWKSITARKLISAAAPEQAPRVRSRKRRLWQPDYFDRFIRSERHYQAVVDYIHNNPVKAGLAATPTAWPWSSALLWERGRPRPQ